MTDPAVQFSKVSKSFGSAKVLREIDLCITPGQFLGLAGVNGAGKTTLIKCLLDFCDLEAGRIEIHGVSWRRPEAREQLAFLPERFMPPYFLTGREFIRSMLRLSRQRWDEARVRAMFDDLDLDHAALAKPVRSYSKGMTQKLGLAASFLSRRDLYIMDEPMSGLDPKARARAKAILARLRAEGRTLLFTSHSLADIAEICDHMVVLHGGSLVFSGTPAALCERHEETTLEGAFLRCTEAPPNG